MDLSYLDEKIREQVNPELINTINKYVTPYPLDTTHLNLIGPVRFFSCYVPSFDKKIIIFGDCHIKEAKCQNINNDDIILSEYIEYLCLKHSNKPIDLYIEIKQREKDIFKHCVRCFLTETANKFDSDLIPNLFLHYCDIRFGNEQNTTIAAYENIDMHINNLRRNNFISPTLREYIEKLYNKKDIDEDLICNALLHKYNVPFPFSVKMVEHIFNETGITDQIESIESDKIGEKMVEHLLKTIKDNNKKYKDNIAQNLVLTLVALMDIFVIAKIFRTNIDLYHDTSDYCIVNVGDAHALDLIEFLKTLEDYQEIHNLYSKDQCIDISNIQDVFDIA